MTTKISGTSAGYISPNDLGYVGLPREAVLDNTPSPAEQRAFAMIAIIPPAVIATYFAPIVALIGGTAALARCGSPGDGENPILNLIVNNDGHGDAGKDGGTTDEGDGYYVADNGRRGNGDALAEADDGGMSVPDDGMTIADIVEPQDIEADQGVVADAGNDGDGLVAADDGMSLPDDGMTIADIADAPDVATPEDGVQDLSETSGVEDVPDVVDSGDVLVAADDDQPVADADAANPPNDVVDPPDVAADTAQPCMPTCTPVLETLTCNEGATNVPASYFVKCATKFVCDGLGTSKVSVNLDPSAQTTQQVTVDKCVKDILFGGCQVVNGDLSEVCGAIKIEEKAKPYTPPTIKQLKAPVGFGILPSGNQCFTDNNKLKFIWDASSVKNETLECTVDVAIQAGGKKIASVTVNQPAGSDMSAEIPANFFTDLTDYCWKLTCTDGIGVPVVSSKTCFTTARQKFIGWWKMNENQGNVVKDWSGNGLNGEIVGKVGWSDLGGLDFDGKTFISLPKSPLFTDLNELSIVIVFTPNPDQVQEAALVNLSSWDYATHYSLNIQKNSFPGFTANVDTKNYSVSSPDPMALGTNVLLVTHDKKGTTLYKSVNSTWKSIVTNSEYIGPLTVKSGGMMTFGCWNDGTHCYKGQIKSINITGANILTLCK